MQTDPTGEYIRYFVPELGKVFGDGMCGLAGPGRPLTLLRMVRRTQPARKAGTEVRLPAAVGSASRGTTACNQTL